MLIQTITDNAEKILLATLEDSKRSVMARTALLCRFSDSGITPPTPDMLIEILKDQLKDRNAVVYYCGDTDIFISWSGSAKDVMDTIQKMLESYLRQQKADWRNTGFFQYFDCIAHGEELRILCKRKLAALAPERVVQTPVIEKAKELNFTPQQNSLFAGSVKQRAERTKPEILIVEDQAFSRTLLMGILAKEYNCHTANNAMAALAQYASTAPDIILLDIELPDANGHIIAQFIRHIDKEVWIIMVTANNYSEDVLKAKQNNVQGFVIKPYNKQKILEIMDKYKQAKK